MISFRLASRAFFFTAVTSVLILACSAPASNESELMVLLPEGKEFLSGCMMNRLGYETDVDLATYHPISVDYFTEIEDFPTKHQRELERLLLLSYEQKDHLDMEIDSNPDTVRVAQLESRLDSINDLVDSIGSYLGTVKKKTVGFVFLHTFVTVQDTMGFIFVMDTACRNTEIVKVRLPAAPPDPDAYKSLVEPDSL